MVLCIDTTGIIYTILTTMTDNITGSIFLTTLVIMILCMAILAACKLPIEYSAIVLLPMLLANLACIGSDWQAITGIVLIYLGIILGKYLFFR